MDNTLDLNKPIEIAYICKTCRTIFSKVYHIKEILKKRIKEGRFNPETDITVGGMNLPRIFYCKPDCRKNRKKGR